MENAELGPLRHPSIRGPNLTLNNNTRFTCDAASTGYFGHRGEMSLVYGGSGTADDASICTKDASGTYTWHSITAHNGRIALTAGTGTVTTTFAQTTSNYQLTNCGSTGTPGLLSIGTITPGTSFIINSSSNTDTSTICWAIE